MDWGIYLLNSCLKDGVKTREDQRKEREKAAVKAGQPVKYPTYEEMRAEEKEEPPYLLFTITDDEDQVVRRLRAPVREGLHRIVWDLKYPALNPVRPADANPTSSGPSSTLALPGKYKVKLARVAAGKITSLGGPVEFEAASLGITSLPADDGAESVAFQKKARELGRAVNAAGAVLRDLDSRIALYRGALKNVTVPHADLYQQIRNLELKLADLRRKLFGDRTKSRIDQDAEPGLSRQVNGVIRDQWQSTSAPTTSQQNTYQIVAGEFAPLLDALKKIVNEDVKIIEKRLEEMGAPFTPGRLPVWKK